MHTTPERPPIVASAAQMDRAQAGGATDEPMVYAEKAKQRQLDQHVLIGILETVECQDSDCKEKTHDTVIAEEVKASHGETSRDT